MVLRQGMFIFALLIIFVLAGCQSSGSFEVSAHDGLLDLSGWDFENQGNVSLDGSWGFYWDELIAPGEFGAKEPKGYVLIPSYWTGYSDFHLPSFGEATYRLVVKTDGLPRLYSLKTPDIYTEYALWINGTLMDASGSFVDSAATYLHPLVFDFFSDASEIDIVLQIKNEAHVFGGIGQSIRLGASKLVHKERNISAAIDLVLIAIGLFAGLYYLILYLFRKTSRELVWFFVLCVSVVLRNLLSNSTLLMQVFPDTPFWLGSKLVTISIPVIIISMLYYIESLFKDEIPVLAFKLLLYVNILYALTVLVAPSGIYSVIFSPYLLTVGVACALGLYLSIKAVRSKKKDAAFLLAGMLLLSSGAVLDTLVYLQLIKINYVLSATLFGFIALQVVLLAKRYAEAFRHAELLSNDLQISLDKLKNAETAFLSAQMKPHFLYNALTTIAEKCETEPKKAGKLILSLSKYLRRTLDYDNLSGLVSLKKELELVKAYTSIERARFANIEVIFDLPDDLPPLHLPPLTLQPLVENAIKHGLRKRREGGRVVVSAALSEHGVEFLVEDNGIGIPQDVLKRLIVLPSGSVSIGLYNINTRLIRLYGEGLSINSKIGMGTRVSFKIPGKED